MSTNDVIQKFTSFALKDVDGRYFTWVYKNGQATMYYLDEHITSITKKGHNTALIEYDDGEIETYKTASDVYLWNDYRKQYSENGQSELVVAPKNKLRLTKEQRKVAERLSEAIKEAHAAGISVLYDESDGTLNMVNGEHIESIGYDGGPHELFGEDFERAGVVTESIGWINTDDSVTFELK